MIELQATNDRFYIAPVDATHKEDLIKTAKPLKLPSNQMLTVHTGIKVYISEDYEECWVVSSIDQYGELHNKDVFENIPFLNKRYTKEDNGKEIILEGFSFHEDTVVVPADVDFARVFHSFMTMNDRVLDLSKDVENNVIYKDDNFIICSVDGIRRTHNLIVDVATGKSYYEVPINDDSKAYLRFSIESEGDNEHTS